MIVVAFRVLEHRMDRKQGIVNTARRKNTDWSINWYAVCDQSVNACLLSKSVCFFVQVQDSKKGQILLRRNDDLLHSWHSKEKANRP